MVKPQTPPRTWRSLFAVVLVAQAVGGIASAAPDPAPGDVSSNASSMVEGEPLSAPTAPAAAEPAARPLPTWRLAYRSVFAGRINALGASIDSKLSFRRLLYKSDDVAWRNNFVAFSLIPIISPAYVRLGAGFDIQPASFLTVWANLEANAFLGTFNIVQSYPHAGYNYGDNVARVLGRLPAGDLRRPYPTLGHQWNAGVDLQVKLGPVAVRNQLRASRPTLVLRPGDTVYYEQQTDQLVPNGGVILNDDLDVVWLSALGPIVGVRANLANAFFGEVHLPTDQRAAAQVSPTQLRVGPVFGYTFFENEGALVDKPTLLLIVNWWVMHRFRAGFESTQALPMLALAFTVQGDFFPWGKTPTGSR